MASWAQRTIGSQVVDSHTASKVTTGTLNAATTIHVGDPAGVHTQIGQGAVRIMRPDSDGEIVRGEVIGHLLGGGDLEAVLLVYQQRQGQGRGVFAQGGGEKLAP